MIGYWNDKLPDGNLLFGDRYSDEIACYPSPLDLVSPGWLGPEKTRLISYLESGIDFLYFCGGSPCRFLCEKRMVGCKEYTDGVWAWPEGLAHYVEVHNVRLPDEFVDYARQNDFQIPKDLMSILNPNYKKPRVISRTFHRITGGRFHWYVDWLKSCKDESFWIEWGKRNSKK